MEIIRQRGWEKFCLHPAEVVTPLIFEFSANYFGGSPYFITVRGKNVQCSASAIRKVYDLEPTADEYNKLVQQGDNPKILTRVGTRLCVPNTEWQAQSKVPQATPASTSAVPSDGIATEAPIGLVPASAFYAMTTNIADLTTQVAALQRSKSTLILLLQMLWQYVAARDESLAANLRANAPKYTPLPAFPEMIFDMNNLATGLTQKEPTSSRKCPRSRSPQPGAATPTQSPATEDDEVSTSLSPKGGKD
ncbi:hypothetical protein K1719_026663 [Acacia pycnantha]|nr:hypothetical protein K1719_026663 [Acacia pycnantha]